MEPGHDLQARSRAAFTPSPASAEEGGGEGEAILSQGAPAGLPGLQALDGGLQRVLGRRPAHPARELAARLAGARRLHRLHLAAVALVLAGTAATACTAGWAA
jgi:hypothetical protein